MPIDPPPGGTRVTLVTGASSGIGRATVLLAAAGGDHVVLAARGRDSLDETARECRAVGAASATVLALDVGDDGAVAAGVRRVLADLGRLDVVVNSAGVVAYGRTEEVPADVFEQVLRTNLVGAVNVARHVVPVLRKQERGTLLIIGSVIGHLTVPSMSPYVLGKWGVRALARQLRVENRDLPGVRILYVAPGGVDTPIYEQAANVAGFEGRPPPPVASAEHAARQLMRRIERGRGRAQLSVANDVIRFGHAVLPRVYDAIVAPLFEVVATDLTTPVAPTSGNVLASRESGNRRDADHGNALVAIARNVSQRMRAQVGTRER